MKFPGNCLLVSLAMAAIPGNRLCKKRNRMGRMHFYWSSADGRSWEFYKRGASGKTYLQNSFYIGEIKEVR
jgi:hypothetical protein